MEEDIRNLIKQYAEDLHFLRKLEIPKMISREESCRKILYDLQMILVREEDRRLHKEGMHR